MSFGFGESEIQTHPESIIEASKAQIFWFLLVTKIVSSFGNSSIAMTRYPMMN